VSATQSGYNPAWTTTNSDYAATITAFAAGGAAQDTPELGGRPCGLRGRQQQHQLLAR
jgi:hypothetical protein